MKPVLIAYAATLLAFLILDGIWLGVIARDSYQQALKGLLRDAYPVAPWVTFYLTYCAVVVYLVIMPRLDGSAVQVALAGAALGFAAYGAYNLTNYAILKGWPLAITIKDLLWGTCATSLISVAGFMAVKQFSR